MNQQENPEQLLHDEQRRRLEEHYEYLFENLEDVFMNDLMDVLYETSNIEQHRREHFDELRTRREKADEILKYLFKGTTSLYDTVVNFCKDRQPAEFYNYLYIEEYDALPEHQSDSTDAAVRPYTAPVLPGRTSPPLSLMGLDAQAAIMDIKVTPVINDKIKDLQSKSQLVYPISMPARGIALLIINTAFIPKANLPPRHGAEHDVQNLSTLFHKLGYNVKIYLNSSRQQIIAEFDDLRNDQTLSSYGSFVLGISTHGGDKNYVCYDGEKLYLREILDYFDSINCPYLAGKPKFMFFDVSSGNNMDSGLSIDIPRAPPIHPKQRFTEVRLSLSDLSIGIISQPRVQTNLLQSFSIAAAQKSCLHPAKSDFVLAFSTYEGYLSHRRTTHGCWFSRILVEVFQKHACEHHIIDLLKIVRRKLSYIENNKGNKQVSVTVDSLLKRFYFFPGI